MKRKHSLYANIILLIGSLLIGMLLMEIVLRFMFPNGYFQYRPIPGVHTTYAYTFPKIIYFHQKPLYIDKN